jgi:predicted  nucleic acid-binding Zn-ribbon protein
MNPELQKLIELQQVDARIGALRAEVAALPKEVAAIEAKLAGSKAKVETAQAAIKTDETARRKHESDIKDQQEKISKYRDQSLKVKTNQEYKALLTEIEHAEKEVARLEDKILEIMVAADTRKETLRQAETTLKADTAENEKEKEHARKQTAEDEQALAELTEQRKQLRAGIGDDTLRHYDRVLKLRGSALAAVHDNQMCSVCRVILRPQVYQDVMKGEEIIACDSCQRLLYFVPPPPKEEAPKEEAAKNGKTQAQASDTAEQPSLETAGLPAGEAAAH